MKRIFGVLLGLIFTAAVLGELARLPVATANGILPNDLLVGILGLLWLFDKTFVERRWPLTPAWWPFLTFIAIALLSLLNASRDLATKELFLSSLYLVRFVEYGLLLFIALDFAQAPQRQKRLKNSIYTAAAALAILGFLQLKFFPDFTELQDYGWDPHINRLLSTWFDPNFVGGLFAFVMSLALGDLLASPLPKTPRQKIALTALVILLLLAVFLTYSRSAYLAAMAGIGLIGVLKSRKILVFGLIAGLLLVSVSDRARDRVTDMVQSAESLFSQETVTLPDATARLRIESWQNALTIIGDHPWIGVGYNTYPYAQADYGFIKELDNHDASGSDSTLLTITATTGFLGLAAYLWLLGTLLFTSFKNRDHGLPLGFVAGTTGLLIHSLFTNSLLFTPLLIFFYTGAGLSLSYPYVLNRSTQSRHRDSGRRPALRRD